MQHTLLLVDDDSFLLERTKETLESKGYSVHAVTSGEAAIEKVKENPFLYALVILDHSMPGKTGAETAQELLTINDDIYILIYSTAATIPFKSGSVEFVKKGGEPETFFRTIEGWCRKFDETTRTASVSQSPSENEKLIAKMSGMAGRSAALAEIAKKVLDYEEKGVEPKILLFGETGTGKECVARALHRHSKRRDFPFVGINCGALSEQLLENELFGHVKGAFTGATSDKMGKFKYANNGTILLDEIGDMSLAFQVKLLRVLQENEFTPVGSNQSIKVDVRIIAATHKDLEEEVKAGRFRQDLFYRINHIILTIPPLRERPEDIEPIIALATERYNQLNRTKKSFLLRTVRFMERFPWKGNVRELEAKVEKYLIDSTTDKVGPEVIERKFFDEPSTLAGIYAELKKRHEDEERAFFEKLRHSAASQRDAAAKLGIPASTIVSTMKRLGLPTTFAEESNNDVKEVKRVS